MGGKMFQNVVPLTACYAGSTNGAASARKLLAARTAESRVEIEASAVTARNSAFQCRSLTVRGSVHGGAQNRER